MAPKQALVFGASGIGGWAITRECLRYPSKTTFARVIALANQTLSKGDFLLTENLDRLDVHSGIDLSHGAAAITQVLKKIPNIEQTTSVFYAGKQQVL